MAVQAQQHVLRSQAYTQVSGVKYYESRSKLSAASIGRVPTGYGAGVHGSLRPGSVSYGHRLVLRVQVSGLLVFRARLSEEDRMGFTPAMEVACMAASGPAA